MMSNEFEKTFGEFLDGEDYDRLQEKLQESLFLVARQAFAAGWQAALKGFAVSEEKNKS